MSLALPEIPPLDRESESLARARQESLTKPRGSLGRLEELSLQLAAITGRPRPSAARKTIVVFAADHGVAAEGVSAYPSEVTAQMVFNFLRGGAAINVLARQAGARVVVVNAGLRAPLAASGTAAGPGGGGPLPVSLIDRPVAPGTASMTRGPAMSRSQAERAVALGLEVAQTEAERGLDLLAAGEMGIGNTTAAAAVACAFTGQAPRDVAGRGTGLGDEGFERKVAAIERALRVNRPDPRDPLDLLAKVGGLEIAAMAGALIGAAARRVPVVLDGFIAGAAALAAVEMAPALRPYLIAAHRSAEAGHRLVLERLALRPLLELELRLGEASGAALAFPIIEASVRLLEEMATFAQAGVSGPT